MWSFIHRNIRNVYTTCISIQNVLVRLSITQFKWEILTILEYLPLSYLIHKCDESNMTGIKYAPVYHFVDIGYRRPRNWSAITSRAVIASRAKHGGLHCLGAVLFLTILTDIGPASLSVCWADTHLHPAWCASHSYRHVLWCQRFRACTAFSCAWIGNDVL